MDYPFDEFLMLPEIAIGLVRRTKFEAEKRNYSLRELHRRVNSPLAFSTFHVQFNDPVRLSLESRKQLFKLLYLDALNEHREGRYRVDDVWAAVWGEVCDYGYGPSVHSVQPDFGIELTNLNDHGIRKVAKHFVNRLKTCSRLFISGTDLPLWMLPPRYRPVIVRDTASSWEGWSGSPVSPSRVRALKNALALVRDAVLRRDRPYNVTVFVERDKLIAFQRRQDWYASFSGDDIATINAHIDLLCETYEIDFRLKSFGFNWEQSWSLSYAAFTDNGGSIELEVGCGGEFRVPDPSLVKRDLRRERLHAGLGITSDYLHWLRILDNYTDPVIDPRIWAEQVYGS